MAVPPAPKTHRGSKFPNNRLNPCPEGIAPGVYVIMFSDCPFCQKLLKTARFKVLIRSINLAGYVFKVIIYPRQVPGGRFNEQLPNMQDWCIAEYAMWLAQMHLFIDYNAQREFWQSTTLLSPLILVVPVEPTPPMLVPGELIRYLTMYDPKSQEFNEALVWITTYLRGKIYGTEEEAIRPRSGARATKPLG